MNIVILLIFTNQENLRAFAKHYQKINFMKKSIKIMQILYLTATKLKQTLRQSTFGYSPWDKIHFIHGSMKFERFHLT